MEGHSWTLRVCRAAPGEANVFTRQHQFHVGAPVSFDQADPAISALEYVLGAIGADLVNGMQVLARKRRIAIEQVEAVVEGKLNNPLIYLGVIGETGHPGLEKVCVRLSVASSTAEETLQHLWQEILATSPLVRTLQAAIELELSLQVVT